MLDITQIDRQGLDSLNADQLRGLVGQLLDRTGRDAHEIVWRDAKIDKLTFEVAQLKRLQYARRANSSTPINARLHASGKSAIAATAIELIGQLYGVEREIKALALDAQLEHRLRRSAPIADALHNHDELQIRPLDCGGLNHVR